MELRKYDMSIVRLAEEITGQDNALMRRAKLHAELVALARELRIRAARIKRLRAHFAKYPPQDQGIVQTEVPDFIRRSS